MKNATPAAIPFAKYHALGNDFITIELQRLPRSAARISALVRAVCDRHIGIGADGIAAYERKGKAVNMRIFNADGSEAEVSGNGLRVLAHHLHRVGLVKSRSFAIRAKNAQNQVVVTPTSSRQYSVQATLGVPSFETRRIPMKSRRRYFISQEFRVGAGTLMGTSVSVGNPHIVFFVDHFDFDWRAFGREVESDKRFPQRVNVEFARIVSRKRVEIRIWERGAGETSSSGTGASATVAAGIANGWLDHRVVVQASAGKLEVIITSLDQPIVLTGPSTLIAAGEYFFDAR